MTLRRFRRLLFAILLFPALPAIVLLCDRHIGRTAAGHHTDRIDEVPATHAALVLGCAETLANGRTNRYFTARMDAAARLYHAGKCRHLLVSGDNGREDYDETAAMAAALVARGVPEARIVRDHAGFATLDSVVRAREVFGLGSFVVVSQRFHNERALYIARHHGIDALGWNAADVSRRYGLKTRIRESLARVKTMLDLHLLHSGPKYLGPKIAVGGDA